MTFDDALDLQNRSMIAFDLALGHGRAARAGRHAEAARARRALRRRPRAVPPLRADLAHLRRRARAGGRARQARGLVGARVAARDRALHRRGVVALARLPRHAHAAPRWWARGSATSRWRWPSARAGADDPPHRRHRHRRPRAAAPAGGLAHAGALPGARPQGPGPRPRAGADRARRPRRAGLVPQRPAGRGHRGAPRGLDPRPAQGLDRGAERHGHAAAGARGRALGREAVHLHVGDGGEPPVAHALLPLEGARPPGGGVGGPDDDRVHALDRLHARRSRGSPCSSASRCCRWCRSRAAGKARFQPIWAEDVADCLVAALERPGRRGAHRSSTSPGRSRSPTTSWCAWRCGPIGRDRPLVHVPMPVVRARCGRSSA